MQLECCDELVSILREYEISCCSIFSDKYEFQFCGQKFCIPNKPFFYEDDICKLPEKCNIGLNDIEYLIGRNRMYGYV